MIDASRSRSISGSWKVGPVPSAASTESPEARSIRVRTAAGGIRARIASSATRARASEKAASRSTSSPGVCGSTGRTAAPRKEQAM